MLAGQIFLTTSDRNEYHTNHAGMTCGTHEHHINQCRRAAGSMRFKDCMAATAAHIYFVLPHVLVVDGDGASSLFAQYRTQMAGTPAPCIMRA